MIHIATISILFIAAVVQVYPSLVPELPVQVPRWALNLFYVLLVLRWPVTPFVLNKLSKGTALVDSISLRSIRGIRFAIPGLVRVECDRLGYSIHLFGKKANRRIGVTFDGLRLTVLHIPSQKPDVHQRNSSLTPELSPLPHESHELSHKKASPMLEWLKSFLPEHWVLSLDEASRAFLRRFFSVLVDFGLQVAPQIISTLSVKFTSVQVTFVELGGLNFTFKDASLGVSVSLQVVPEHQMTDEQRRELRAAQRSQARHWRDRLAGTVSRTVLASWKGRQGTASVSLKLNDFTLFNPSPPPVRRQRAQSTVSVDSGGWTHFTDIDVEAPENAVVHVSGETEISARCDFDPRKGKVAYHSTRIQSRVPDVTVFVDVLQALINDIRSMIPTTPSTPTYTSIPSSPSPLTPLTSSMHSAPTSPLFSPPVSATFSVASSSPRTKKSTKPKDRNLMQYFNSAGVEVSRFTIQYTSTKSKEPIQYKSQIIGLDFGLKLSDPKQDEIHTKWLGKGGKPTLETCKAWFRFTDVIVHRDHDLTSDDGHIRIIKTAGLDAQILLHQFPTPLLRRKGDATEPFIACEIDMESIEATENLNIIRKRLARPSKVKPSDNEQIQQLQRLHNIPKLAVDIRVGDMKGRLICDDEKAFAQDVGLDVQFDSAEFHIRSDYDQFKAPQKTSTIRGARVSDCFPSYNFAVHAAVHSPSIRTTHATGDEDFPSVTRPKLGAPSHGGFSRLEDPVLLLEGLEFHASGNLIGKWTGEDITLDRGSLMADARLIIDVVHIELWTLSSLEALTHFLYQLKTARAKSSRRGPTLEPSQTNLMDALPSGIQIHAAIAKLSIGATGKDFNPECHLDLYRGLLFTTSLMFRYSSVITAKHNSRARGRFKLASARENLRLPEDLLMQAFAHANESDDPKCRSAVMETVLSGTIVRRVVGNQFGVDEHVLNTPIAQVGQDAITLSIPRTRAWITLTRRTTPEYELVDKAHVVLEIKVINGHIQLLDAYCCLLAMQTVGNLLGVETKLKSKAPATAVASTSSKMHVVVNGKVASAQFICQLPLDQVLHARWNVLSFNVPDANNFDLKWTSASVLVPSGLFRKGHDRRWEELIRLPSWRIAIVRDPVTGEPSIDILGDYARIRIPNGFVPADTILSVTLAIKAAKHLTAVTSTGVYSQMPTPPSEPAKNVSNITVKINGLLFEATDSPIEARLNLAFRHNIQAQRMRLEHEDAFDAKVAKIEAAAGKNANIRRVDEWNFTTEHSVGINEARHRLRELFSNMWINQIQDAKATAMAREESMSMRFRENKFIENESALPVSLYIPPSYPPLFRLTLNGVSASIRSPRWSGDQLASFMEDLGQGIPRDTEFTLLVPLHVELALDSARLVLRDLPLPIFNVPPCSDKKSLTFITDLVIGEEIGPASSVRWVRCDVAAEDADALGTAAFNMLIPKTTMPVKTYAQPEVKVSTSGITDMCWGVSFLPIMQEVMKVIDGLSTLPVDPSPGLGFWDKLRLIMHWRTSIQFSGEVHVHLKGSRNAWKTTGSAVGIALCAKRNTRITIGHPNPQNELVQLLSDDMLIVIPSLKHFENSPSGLSTLDYELGPAARQPQKVVAKLVNGVRIGAGFTFERTCAVDCEKCRLGADAFHRSCRMFDFKPHYEVALRANSEDKGKDSFLGFRSDFIHCGFSMHSPITPGSAEQTGPNSVHLTPRVFAHFWSLLKLFDNALALPIRQGKMWPGARPPSEKFGQHLATIKFRLCLDDLSIAHTYKQDSQDSWGNGEVPSVGVKALVKSLRADLHQRDEEIRIQTEEGGSSKSVKYTRAKSLYGAEVRMTDIYMRAVVAIFREPDLQFVVNSSHPDFESPYSVAPLSSINDAAFDKDDYTELDWLPTDQSPKFYMGEVASCPEFSFVKKIEKVRLPSDDPTQGVSKMSKFGSEPSHECIMGRELDPRQVQLSMATQRRKDLEAELKELDPMDPSVDHYQTRHASLVQRINLLSVYIEKLLNPPPSATPSRLDQLHGNWTESDWDSFDNRYYIHAPKLSLSNGTRNILLQYYYESRRRRGFEYHMASSAVRFIRDHAMATEGRKEEPQPEPAKAEPPSQGRSKSGNAVKRLFVRQPEVRKMQDTIAGPADVDHNIGVFEQTDMRRTHFCLLFKPQIVLRSNLDDESVIIISANDAAIQTANVMDKRIDDPVNGHMLTKIHFILSGMQIFSPSPLCSTTSTAVQLPFEVFLDDLCETVEYDRIVLHTSCVVQYDKYNRLRLRTASQATPQSDMLLANVRSFTLQANSDHFSSLYNVVTDLLLYSDPSNRTRLDRLEAFILNDDISDSATTASEIAIRQGRIRALSEHLNDYTLREGDLSPSDRMEMNRIAATLMTQTEELGLIFDAVQTVQDRDELASQSKVGIRLEATSPELTWNLIDNNGSLLAKLALRSMDFLWISSQDGSSANRLKIKDLEAVDARPNAKFPEMISKHKKWLQDNPMAKSNTLLEVVWNTAAPVGGISILTNFDLSFHPINVQLDASVGHKIQTYIFPKDRSRRYHSTPDSGDGDTDQRSPDSDDAADLELMAPSRKSLDERPGRGMLKAPRVSLSRSSSHSDLGRMAHEDGQRSRRVSSNRALGDHGKQQPGSNGTVAKAKLNGGVAEMRARSAENRTFVSARINCSGICLSFRRDKDLSVIIPDINDLRFETPEIVFGNRTCSFRDILQEFKWELISKTGNVLLTSGGLKSFNFSGIKDRLLPGKRQIVQTRLEPPAPIHRQIGHVKDSQPSSSSDANSTSDASSTLAMSDIPSGRKSTSSNYTFKSSSRRTGSIDSGSRRSSDHGHGEDVETKTPRGKLMSLLHRNESPRSSPSRKSSLAPSSNSQS